MSCPLCNDLQGTPKRAEMPQDWKGNRGWKKTDISYDALQNSAHSCHTCSVLLTGCRGCLDGHGIDMETDVLHCTFDFAYPNRKEWEGAESEGYHEAFIDKEIRLYLKNGSKFEVEMFLPDNPSDESYEWPDCWEIIPSLPRTSDWTGSDSAFSVIGEWIDGCLSNAHDSCRSPDDPPLPTRIVSVGGPNDQKVHLVQTEGQRGKYVCLSHCWGQKQIITTTGRTLDDHVRSGIPLTELSNTFREAVLFTRRLGFQYIWIDSLCIIQDDTNDWQRESAQMAAIYSNSHLTLAATQSANGDGGLYCQTPDFLLSGTTPMRDDYNLVFRRRIDHHIDCTGVEPGSLSSTVDSRGLPTVDFHPLLTRAWVYQERILSTRVVHFGPHEVFFECRTSLQCECNGIGYHGTSDDAQTAAMKILHTDAIHGFKGRGWRLRDDDLPWLRRTYIARLWRTMVADYTSLNITKASDRLPAIGGLAREMATRRPHSQYLAGLWAKSLRLDLLWRAQGASMWDRPRPHPRTAPTWSWASVEGFVMFGDEILAWDYDADPMFAPRFPREHFGKVERCEVTPGGIDEFGHIAGGVLEMTGLVVEGVLGRSVGRQRGREVFVHHVTVDGRDYSINEDYSFSRDGPGQMLPGTLVVCLRMSLIQRVASAKWLESLVLRPYGTAGGHFNRIGTMSISMSPEDASRTAGVFDGAVERTVTIT